MSFPQLADRNLRLENSLCGALWQTRPLSASLEAAKEGHRRNLADSNGEGTRSLDRIPWAGQIRLSTPQGRKLPLADPRKAFSVQIEQVGGILLRLGGGTAGLFEAHPTT